MKNVEENRQSYFWLDIYPFYQRFSRNKEMIYNNITHTDISVELWRTALRIVPPTTF